MAARKHISQREALRLRKEVRELRTFVYNIRGVHPSMDNEVMTVNNLNEKWRAEAHGISWGAQGRVAVVARFSGTQLLVGIVRTPKLRGES